MGTWSLLVLGATTVCGIASIYAPQPLLPVLSEAFHVGESTVGLAVTATMLPLGLAPLVYGFILDAAPAKPVVTVALTLLACCCAGLCLCPGFSWFLAVRLLQGLVVPALLTALMTYLAASAKPGRVRWVMAVYIAVTVFGGFFGRFASGLTATLWGWRVPFAGLAVALGCCAALCLFLPPDSRSAFAPMELAGAPKVLRKKGFAATYLVIGLLFFVFSGMLNLLPFRLARLEGGYTPLHAGLMYFGYLTGILVCLTSHRMAERLGGPTRAMTLGAALVIGAVAIFAVPSRGALFASVFVLCAGMFLAHSVAPGVLNGAEAEHKGLVNGLYISFYYSGGALGSYLPGLVQAQAGFTAAVAVLVAAGLLATGITIGLGRTVFTAT